MPTSEAPFVITSMRNRVGEICIPSYSILFYEGILPFLKVTLNLTKVF